MKTNDIPPRRAKPLVWVPAVLLSALLFMGRSMNYPTPLWSGIALIGVLLLYEVAYWFGYAEQWHEWVDEVQHGDEDEQAERMPRTYRDETRETAPEYGYENRTVLQTEWTPGTYAEQVQRIREQVKKRKIQIEINEAIKKPKHRNHGTK